jgi:hypothetical protein
MKHTLLRACFGALLAFSVTACGVDDQTLEAQLEKAQIAIDHRDYASAEAILEGLCPVLATCRADILSLLAEAQMGLGRVDALNLLSLVDTLPATPGTTDVFDVVDTMFGSDGFTSTNVDDLQSAIDTLSAIPSPTADEQFQLLVAATAHMVAAVLLATDPDNNGVFDTGGVTAGLTTTVNTDLDTVETNAAAVDAYLGGTTDITGDLAGLRADIEGASPDGTVSQAELTTFIGSL